MVTGKRSGSRTDPRMVKTVPGSIVRDGVCVTVLCFVLFFYACAPSISSEGADTEVIANVADTVSAALSQDTPAAESIDTTSRNVSAGSSKNTLQTLNNREMRMISGKEGLTIDTHTYDRTVEKDEIVEGRDTSNDYVILAPVDVDLTIGEFTVQLNPEGELESGPQAGTIVSEIPSLNGSFSVGLIRPGGGGSYGKVGMQINYPGGGQVTVSRK